MQILFLILMGLAMAGVVAAMGAGLMATAQGGAPARARANRMMRWRVFAQGLALLFFALALLAG